ncbi:MAG: DsbA family protein [Hyphomonadaceae bacterium]|nr:DsbA family protein [Hyphomonadaceae bacterium]
MKTVEVFWSFRSPYSYLATRRLRSLPDRWQIRVRPRVVYPIAIRTPEFFQRVAPQWTPYLLRDIFRLSEYLGLPMARPNPDPVSMNMATREIAKDQPHIHRLSRLGVLACETGDAAGWAFLDEVSTLIWSGQAWTESMHLANAVARAGLDLADLDTRAEAEEDRIEREIEISQTELDKHHWGVPTMVLEDEVFFGQDRIDLLEWRLEQQGVPRL